MPAHVFNVPKPYRAQAQEPQQQQPQEKSRSKFRWFGHTMRLGGSSSKAVSNNEETDDNHRRTKSSYITSSQEPVSPTSSTRSASFSSTTSISIGPAPSASKGLNDSFSLHKLNFSLLRSGHSSSPTSSVRTSIASTASSSEDAPFSLTAQELTCSSSSDHGRPTADDHQIHSPRIEYETRKLLRQVMGMDAVWADDDHVQRHFVRLRWRVVRIEADGNCLFRAISDQIYRNEAFYDDIRRRIVEFIDREKELFQPFVENEQKDTHEPISAYCTRMKKDAQWGGNPELYAAASLFNVHVVVHQGPLRRLRIENGSQTPFMELHLLYRNDHYDSLHDETQLDDKPRLSITAALALEDETEKESEGRAEEEPLVKEPVVEQTEKKRKRKKGVVFLGEETRVERVDVDSFDFVAPPVVIRMPVRAVVRYGKVCDPSMELSESNQEDESSYQPQEETYEELDESEQTPSIPEEEESSVTEAPQDNQTDAAKDVELPVVAIKKVSFRRGRRVAA